MRIIEVIFFLSFLSFSGAAAGPQCKDVFSSSASNFVRNFKLTGVVLKPGGETRKLLGQDPERWWDTWWHYHGEVDETYTVFGNRERQSFYRQSPRGYGLQGQMFVSPAWAKDALRGIGLVHQGYGHRFTESEKDLMTEVDAKGFDAFYAKNQLGYAGVETSEKLVGFLRVVDGNRGVLPAEQILEAKQIKSSYFDELRSTGFKIFEIGKYALDPSLNPKELKLVRNALFQWLLDSYIKQDDKIVFIIDVGSIMHERAYRNMFGATRVEQKYFEPALNSPDFILQVDGKTLRERLQKIIQSDSE